MSGKNLSDKILEYANAAEFIYFPGDPENSELAELLYRVADYMERAHKYISYHKNIPASILKEDYYK